MTSTVAEQSVHLDLDDPDVENHLNRWLPLGAEGRLPALQRDVMRRAVVAF